MQQTQQVRFGYAPRAQHYVRSSSLWRQTWRSATRIRRSAISLIPLSRLELLVRQRDSAHRPRADKSDAAWISSFQQSPNATRPSKTKNSTSVTIAAPNISTGNCANNTVALSTRWTSPLRGRFRLTRFSTMKDRNRQWYRTWCGHLRHRSARLHRLNTERSVRN